MKMGTLLLGGVLGAWAAMYVTRNKRWMMLSNFANAGKQLEGMMGMGQGQDQNQKNSSERTSKQGSKSDGIAGIGNQTHGSKSAGGNKDNGLSRVKDIIEEEPRLKVQVQEILAESKKDSHANLHQ
jgi:hypothetical protein